MSEKESGQSDLRGDHGRIDSLERDLYSRKKDQIAQRKRRELHTRDYGVSDSWDDIPKEIPVKSRRPFIKIILAASIAFFVISAIFSTFFFFKGVNISPSNVVIHVEGPALVGGGEELDLQITIKNNNPVPIETADLIVEYPDGTRSAANVDIEQKRHREALGTVNPGEEVRRSVSAVLFGEEGSNKMIDVVVEYRVRGSNAIFNTESQYELALSSSPLSLAIDSLEEAISGQEVSFTATVKSNSTSVVQDAMLTVEYPFGFEFIDASEDPIFANRTWYLGDIQPEEEVALTFRGTLSGQDGEERVFRFVTGLQSEVDSNRIGAEFIKVSESLFIKRPFITADLTVKGERNDVVIESGEEVRADISWANNLTTQIFDGEIEVQISGDAFDRTKVKADSGFFRSVDNKVIWTRETDSDLGTIPSGGSGNVSFTFGTFGIDSGRQFNNPVINLDVTVRGKRLSDGSVPEEIVSTVSKEVKVQTDLAVTSKLLYNTGPFTNTGPIPPKAEQETTYTVLLSVLNSSNEIANGQVVMTLPPYVEWVGAISPLTENVTFSPVGGRIIWNLDEIEAGVGTTRSLREVAFQIRFLPSISQIGDTPILVNRQTVSGFDRFTETQIESSRAPLDTFINEAGFIGDSAAKVTP